MTYINKQVMAMKILVRPINIGSIEQEYIELEVKKTQSLKEVYIAFQAYLAEEQNCSEDDYDFEIDRIAIIQESRPNIKLPASGLINKIVIDGNNCEKFTFIFPRDNLPIIQIQGGEKFYYIDNYGKDEFLYVIIQMEKEIKKIVESEGYEYIKINGQMINYKTEKDKKDKKIRGFLENNINKMINISIRLKDKKQKEGGKRVEEIKVEEPKIESVKKQEVSEGLLKQAQIKKGEKLQQVQQKIEEKKEENQEIKKEENLQQPQPILPVQQPQAQANLLKNQPNKDLLKLVIKFQSTISNKKQEFLLPVDPSKSMLQLLPQIVKQLKSRGFDWQETGFDKSRGDLDKLSIIYDRSQFKKFDRPLRSFVNLSVSNKMILTVERHYDGGA